ncbi:hypothetical protein LOD99_7054 [Oopsacas minuta]|uniref:BZIP domain-containing protein n=1 Tax=Oopsacas minuta TaxID=111878 RepID=A0AAV7JK07_9METZ|nr:hypothetical protein LOD99_7054 [Oopsacas minuta]
MMSTNSSTVYVRYPNYFPQTPGLDLQQQQRSFSFLQGQTKDDKNWMTPVAQQQLQVQSLPGSMAGICLQQPTHNSMMLSTPLCPTIYFPPAAALQATNYPLPMQFIQAPSTLESVSNSAPDIKDPLLLKSALKSPPSTSDISGNIVFTPSSSSSIKMHEQMDMKNDIRPSNSVWDVFSPSQQSGVSNLGSPTLSIRDEEDDLTSIRSDEEIELLTSDSERKFHINKEYLADLAIQAQADPDVFGKISFVVFQELVDSEFLSPSLKQKARHYRRRHRNKLAAKICRDKKQTKIKDLNGEIDDLKKQIYMVKSERDMLRNEVEKLSEVHMKKGDKD